MTFTTFGDAEVLAAKLIGLLHKLGVTPPAGSKIEGEMLSPLQLLEATRNMDALRHDPKLWADAGGMYDLAAKILAIENQPELASFLNHLRLFGAGGEFATVVQVTKGDIRDETDRKLTELYLGTLAVHFAFDVELDDPVSSRGDNPDVLFALQVNEGPTIKWGLAIKSVSSRNGQTIFENIQKAGRQIDATACPADRGMVVVNLKNALRHDEFWKRSFASFEEAKAMVTEDLGALIDAAKAQRPASDWESVFAGRTSPCVLFMAQAVVKLRAPGGREIPTILKVMRLESPLGRADPMAEAVAERLNHFMQTMLRGQSGTPGALPA